ncbi:MerR family transcriptional regulator [Oenococcus alcoholitolerans]|uniref:MerR family transcriptional regulator n=1 Tax=Oenococcus alcoholitolerans TaxID=931074 RepID=UPI003F72EAF8
MKIKEVSEKYSIPADTLRYWERVGAIPRVNRDEAGYRDYDKESLDWIEFAQCMRHAGVSVEYLVEYLQLFKQGDKTLQARKDLLDEQLETIYKKKIEIDRTYTIIKDKVQHYEQYFENNSKK